MRIVRSKGINVKSWSGGNCPQCGSPDTYDITEWYDFCARYRCSNCGHEWDD
jgi:predicted RNA-binding Zn-ribbon protein involved in translation (DUF1610 family)